MGGHLETANQHAMRRFLAHLGMMVLALAVYVTALPIPFAWVSFGVMSAAVLALSFAQPRRLRLEVALTGASIIVTLLLVRGVLLRGGWQNETARFGHLMMALGCGGVVYLTSLLIYERARPAPARSAPARSASDKRK